MWVCLCVCVCVYNSGAYFVTYPSTHVLVCACVSGTWQERCINSLQSQQLQPAPSLARHLTSKPSHQCFKRSSWAHCICISCTSSRHDPDYTFSIHLLEPAFVILCVQHALKALQSGWTSSELSFTAIQSNLPGLVLRPPWQPGVWPSRSSVESSRSWKSQLVGTAPTQPTAQTRCDRCDFWHSARPTARPTATWRPLGMDASRRWWRLSWPASECPPKRPRPRATGKVSTMFQHCFHTANSPVPVLRVLTRSTDYFTPLLTRPIMHCTRTMPQSHPRSSSMAAAPEHWHCQQWSPGCLSGLTKISKKEVDIGGLVRIVHGCTWCNIVNRVYSVHHIHACSLIWSSIVPEVKWKLRDLRDFGGNLCCTLGN